MGKGNYVPRDRYRVDYEMVYVDSDNWRQLADEIRRLLPPSFWCEDGWDHNEKVIAENSLLSVRLADNDWSTAVVVRPPLDDEFWPLYGLAYRHLPNIARKIFDGLRRRGHELHIRTGPWTSAPYREAS